MSRNINFTNHGGGCCGISHLFGFGYRDMNADDWFLINNDPYMGGAFEATREDGRCLEVVLTDEQIHNMPGVAGRLKDEGFKLVNRFYNANSSNYCNVLHLTRDSEDHESLKEQSPFNEIKTVEDSDKRTAPTVRTVDNQRLNGYDGRRVFVVIGNGVPCHHHWPEGAYIVRTGETCVSEGVEHYRLTEPSLAEHPAQFIADEHVRRYVPGESRGRG